MSKPLFQIDENFGSGGTGLAPDGGSGPAGGRKNLRDMLRAILAANFFAYADATAMTASVDADRADGQRVTKLDDYSTWIWKALDATAADATHIKPTDVGVGAGRFVKQTTADLSSNNIAQKLTIDVPLATLQAKTSGTAFNIGAALPANAYLLGEPVVRVVEELAGGTVSAATAKVGKNGEADDTVIASTNVFTGAGLADFATRGSNPYPKRGGQQLQMKVTLTGDTMAHLTAGHLAVEFAYATIP